MHEAFGVKGKTVYAGAGSNLLDFIKKINRHGFRGMEKMAGIPGTVAGAIYGNAGAYGQEIKDNIFRVRIFDGEKIKWISKNKCKFGYRSSIFKKNPNFIVLSCKLKLKKENKEKIKERTREILDHRKSHHPFNPSAGSIFKNFKHVRARDLIEKAGLKGKQIGEAQISQLHANFIVNCGGAKAKDVLKLINLAKKEVKNKFGIKLEEEIQKIS